MKTYRFKIQDSSYAGEIRRTCANLADILGFGEALKANIPIVINEICSNICKHAGNGEVLLAVFDASLHVLALDKGPGMRNAHECLKDGFSTSGTAGTGLGAISRLASRFDIYSQENRGTALYAAFCEEAPDRPFELGAVNVPHPGEEVSGDGWSWVSKGPRAFKIAVADGLGHGLLANRAAETVAARFPALARQSPLEDIESLHQVLRATRGAALAIAELDLDNGKVNYAGLGNIVGTLVSPVGVRRMISYNGTVGVQLRKVQAMSYPLAPETLLVMHSDGLVTHWDLHAYPGLVNRHPFLAAGILFRDFNRNTDDVIVLVARIRLG